jgi:hypothetical protein
MYGSEPTREAFGGVAGRVLKGSLSVGPLLSGLVLLSGLGMLGYMLRAVDAPDLYFALVQITVVLALCRFALNGLAGEWEGTLFSSPGGSILEAAKVSLRYGTLTLVWLLPVLLLGWRPQAVTSAIAQLMMGEGVTKVLALTAVFLTLTALTPPVFLIVSVGANRYIDIADQRHWRRLFQNRAADLFVVYSVYLGALGMVLCLSLPLFSLLAGHKEIATFIGFLFVSFAGGMSLDLLGRLCGFFASHEAVTETIEERMGEVDTAEPTSTPTLRLVTGTPRAHREPAAVSPTPAVPVLKVLSPTGKPPLLDARERLDELERRREIDPEGVISTLKDMQESYAPHPLVLHGLCITLFERGNTMDSLLVAREALPLCLERGAQRLAAEIYGAHIDQDFGLSRDTVLLLAQDLRRHGQLDAAERAFGSIIDRDRGDRRAVKGMLQVAEDHLVRSEYSEAQRLFRMLLDRCGDSPLAMHMHDGLAEAERRLAKAS